MVETIDSIKTATTLNNYLLSSNRKEPLKVLVQVNTSGEICII